MHIACVNQDPGIAPSRQKGAAVHLEAMRGAFAALGARVTALDLPQGNQVFEALSKAHAKEPLQLIYERYALDAFAGFEFARERELPFVLEVNAPLAEEARTHRASNLQVDAVRERALFSQADLILVVSSALKLWAIQQGAEEKRVLVRPNAVDAELFRPIPSELRRQLSSAPEGSLVLGFHGRLRPWHNFEMLCQAVTTLTQLAVPVHLCCIGDPELELRCKALLPHATYSYIPWLPHDQVAQRVACFDVLPLTYAPQDNFYFSPLKLLEAMACGVVPTVPDLGDLAQVVQHESSGIVYRAGDLEALVRALQSLHRNPQHRSALSVGARKRALKTSWIAVAGEVLQQATKRAKECRRP